MRLMAPELGLSPASNLGGAVYDREILAGLAALGVECLIPYPQGEPVEPAPGWRIRTVPRCRRYTYEYNLRFLPAAMGMLRQPGFDLVRVHTPSISLLGWSMARLARVPLVAHHHHLEEKHLPRLLERFTLRRAALITTDSRYSARRLAEAYRLDPERICVVYPGVDPRFQPLLHPETDFIPVDLSGKIVLATLGVLAPRKNIAVLLEALALALREDPRLFLLVGGSGPEHGHLVDYANRLGLNRAVHFTGYLPEDRKVPFINRADIFVFPSRLEGFGMALAEAMACGLPAIASTAASLPEVVGSAGLLADPSDPQAFAALILRLAANPDLRQSLGAAGRAHVRQSFSWERSARLTFEAYSRLLASPRR